MKIKCFDHETTGTDTQTCHVVQSALVQAPLVSERVDMSATKTFTQLFHAPSIPAGATAVHGITAEDVKDCAPFLGHVRKFVGALTAEDTISLSYNGTGFDIPLTARIAETAGMGPRAHVEKLLCRRHVDMMRVWLRVKQDNPVPPWQAQAGGSGAFTPDLSADMFGGTLTACHGFLTGRGFLGAHDASVDCFATLECLDVVLSQGLDIETLIAWSNEPLPGDVDFAGKFKWDEDGEAIIAFSKHKGTLLRDIDKGFLDWMLKNDFHEDTKTIVRAAMQRRYPQKRD